MMPESESVKQNIPSAQSRHLKWLIAPLLAILFAVVAFYCLLISTQQNHADPQFDNGLNAAWVSVDWVNEEHDKQSITELAEELTRQRIKYVYVFVSYMKPGAKFNPTYSYAGEFVSALKEENPELNVQAWLGFPLESRYGDGYVDFGDIEVQTVTISFCIDLIQELGFDGVHLDPEPVVNNDSKVLVMLDDIRRGIGPDAALSMSTRRIWPFRGNMAQAVGQFAWQADYYREVAQRVDQVAVMTYDSTLPHPALYRYWVRSQVIRLSQALYGIPVELLIGLPASEERTFTHRPFAENMRSGLMGTLDGLYSSQAWSPAVTGVAVYPFWEMDAEDWASYGTLWLGKMHQQ